MTTTKNIFSKLLLPLAIFTSACGGGTSGSSSPIPLMLTGYAEQADGSRGAGLTMSVRSESSTEVLKASGTDQNGDFSMELPASERGFLIDVDGIGSTRITRRQSGEGNISTKLRVTSDGELITKDLFEAQLVAEEPCDAIEVYNNRILIVGALTDTSCKVRVSIASSELMLDRFRVSLTGACPGQTGLSSSVTNSNQPGGLIIDLSQALAKSCTDLSLTVTHSDSPGLESRFTVE